MSLAFGLAKYFSDKEVTATSVQFNLLRWFSLASFLIITLVALGLGFIATRFVVNESIQRDAVLTAQFIQSMGAAEVGHHNLPGYQMGELLDPRDDIGLSAQEQRNRQAARNEFLDHITHIARQPDSLLISIYAPDDVVIWSSNPELIGQKFADDDELEESFSSKERIFAVYHEVQNDREEQQFVRRPENLFIENYIPMLNSAGKAVATVEIYKEPSDLIARTQRGYMLMWLATSLGGALIYLGLYLIVRRAAALLVSQQKQLIENETFVALGEMSAAVAHSLRNPLATIRSSAELAQELANPPVQKNISDIIGQVDRMSKWVRDLLQASSPHEGANEEVDPLEAILETLHAFEPQIRKANVLVEFTATAAPPVFGQRILLSQVLNSLVSNALEAMAQGGRLRIDIQPNARRTRLHITLHDTGKGMTENQQQMLFKPFCTSKQGGLGVGLVMVKRIMERFGGQISLTSRENEGTQVRLTFRIAKGR
ncbi:ATP-binding protein [Pseudomonas sp. LS1212]|uniref:sensor histidine kinase n=1 Tax=Pseudomonas sp. LS1212 TaxID=2972478 RepID=UPI00215B8CBD|nr:ATP-binding protein [Pseudomonas sp. LS1212]UVJ41825.1 ATP-binding protein [Pseudomonas sp. LS1212]